MIMMMMMRRESKIIERWEGERKRVSNFLCFVMHNMLIIIHIYIFYQKLSLTSTPPPLAFFSFFDASFLVLFWMRENNKEGERERVLCFFMHGMLVVIIGSFFSYIVLSFCFVLFSIAIFGLFLDERSSQAKHALPFS